MAPPAGHRLRDGLRPHRPDVGEDPYPIYDDLRERCPVAHSDRYGGTWLPTRHEDVVGDRQRPGALHEPGRPGQRGPARSRRPAGTDRHRAADHLGPAVPPARAAHAAPCVLAEGHRPARALHEDAVH